MFFFKKRNRFLDSKKGLIVNEKCLVFVNKHPHYQSLNKKLLQDVQAAEYPAGLSYEDKYCFYAKHSSFGTSSKSIDLVNSWVISILVYYKDWLENSKLYCSNSWFAEYGKGDWVDYHDHTPSFFSYVYFIKTPKGPSPLVFSTSGTKIKAEEGKVVIFPSNMYHYVPKNNCEGRITLAGNIDPNK